MGKGKIKGCLKVEEIEGSEIRGAGGASRVEDGSHARGEDRGCRSSGSSGRAENKILDLDGREKRVAVDVIIRKDIGAGVRAESIKFIRVEGVELGRGNGGVTKGGGRRWGSKIEALRDAIDGGRGVGRGKRSLGKSEPEIEGNRRKRETVIESRRVNGGSESKVGDTVGAGGGVGGDSLGNRVTMMVAKTESN